MRHTSSILFREFADKTLLQKPDWISTARRVPETASPHAPTSASAPHLTCTSHLVSTSHVIPVVAGVLMAAMTPEPRAAAQATRRCRWNNRSQSYSYKAIARKARPTLDASLRQPRLLWSNIVQRDFLLRQAGGSTFCTAWCVNWKKTGNDWTTCSVETSSQVLHRGSTRYTVEYMYCRASRVGSREWHGEYAGLLWCRYIRALRLHCSSGSFQGHFIFLCGCTPRRTPSPALK